MLSQLLCLGRHTVTGLLGTSGRLFCDWTADYRMYSHERIDPHQLFAPVRRTLSAQFPPHMPIVVALDDTRVHKTGRHTPGVKYTRDPMGPPFHINFVKAQRFLQISLASPSDNGMARMIPIDFAHTPAPQRPRCNADQQTRAQYRAAKRVMALPKVATDRLQELRFALDADGHQSQSLWALVDGGYTNRTLLKHLPSRTVVIGRIRSDAKLYDLPDPIRTAPGRNRVYGRRAPTPEQVRQDDSIPWQTVEAFAAGKRRTFKIKTVAPLRWRPAGKNHDLRLIVIAPLAYKPTPRSRGNYRSPAFLICTDPNAPVEHILQAYVWRWDIELNFRDEKTLLGLGQAQVRHQRSVENVPTLAVAAYAMLLTSAALTPDLSGPSHSLNPPKWRPNASLRPSTQSLIQRLRHEVWAHSLRFSSFVSHSPSTSKPQKLDPSPHGALFYSMN